MQQLENNLFDPSPNSSGTAEQSSTTPEPATPAHVVPDDPAEAAVGPANSALPPRGKLGLVMTRLAHPNGATIEGLAEETGWQRHTLRAAMSRLRRKGYRIERSAEAGGGTTYRLVAAEG